MAQNLKLKKFELKQLSTGGPEIAFIHPPECFETEDGTETVVLRDGAGQILAYMSVDNFDDLYKPTKESIMAFVEKIPSDPNDRKMY